MLLLEKVEIPLSIQMMASTGYFHLINHSHLPDTALPGTGLSGSPSAPVEIPLPILLTAFNGQVSELLFWEPTVVQSNGSITNGMPLDKVPIQLCSPLMESLGRASQPVETHSPSATDLTTLVRSQ